MSTISKALSEHGKVSSWGMTQVSRALSEMKCLGTRGEWWAGVTSKFAGKCSCYR